MPRMQTPEYAALMDIVEPYEMPEPSTMPKLILNGSQDEFFVPDSSQFYIDDLPGLTRLRYVPNAGHGLNRTAIESVIAFMHAILNEEDMPAYRWDFPDANTIEVMTDTEPETVTLWVGNNPESRDFRIERGPLYEAVTVGEASARGTLTESGSGEGITPFAYEAKVPAPAQGFTAYFIELTYDSPSGAPQRFTTPIRFVPVEMPFTYEDPNWQEGGFMTEAAAAGQ
jgi:PhoPQ-activated pathogenicity-related protein